MKSLPGHGEANEFSFILCALERGRAEQKTRDTGCEMRPLSVRSGCAECASGFAGDRHQQEAEEALFFSVSPRCHSSLARSLLRGLCDAQRQARSSASAAQPCGLRFPSAMDPP